MLLRPTSLAFLTALTLAAAPVAALADTTPTTQVAAEKVSTDFATDHATPAAPTADSSVASTYAQREQSNQAPAKFNGGSVVVIGVSGGALLVILILLLLLL